MDRKSCSNAKIPKRVTAATRGMFQMCRNLNRKYRNLSVNPPPPAGLGGKYISQPLLREGGLNREWPE